MKINTLEEDDDVVILIKSCQSLIDGHLSQTGRIHDDYAIDLKIHHKPTENGANVYANPDADIMATFLWKALNDLYINTGSADYVKDVFNDWAEFVKTEDKEEKKI